MTGGDFDGSHPSLLFKSVTFEEASTAAPPFLSSLVLKEKRAGEAGTTPVLWNEGCVGIG